jgi:hypothetical protein
MPQKIKITLDLSGRVVIIKMQGVPRNKKAPHCSETEGTYSNPGSKEKGKKRN